MTTAAAQPGELRIASGFFLKIGGVSVQEEITDDLILARIEGSVHLPDMALLEFRTPDFKWTENNTFEVGKEIEVTLGDPSHKRPVFLGEITGVEVSLSMTGGIELQVRAFDRAHRLHRGRTTKVYLNVTD